MSGVGAQKIHIPDYKVISVCFISCQFRIRVVLCAQTMHEQLCTNKEKTYYVDPTI